MSSTESKYNEDYREIFQGSQIRELRIWKGDMRSLLGMVSDDGHLLIGDEPRKTNFQELRETSTSMRSTSCWRVLRKKIQVEGWPGTKGLWEKLQRWDSSKADERALQCDMCFSEEIGDFCKLLQYWLQRKGVKIWGSYFGVCNPIIEVEVNVL